VHASHADARGDPDLELPHARDLELPAGRLLDGLGEKLAVVVRIDGAQEDDDSDHQDRDQDPDPDQDLPNALHG
jgi:hypothetical protein